MIPPEWKDRIWGWIQTAAARWDIIGVTGDRGKYEIESRDEDGNTWQDPAPLYQHYGLRSRPGARSEAITVPAGRGAASQRVIIATRSAADIPEEELADWEVDLYARFKQRVYMREDGRLALSTDGPLITLLGGDTQLQRVAATSPVPTAAPMGGGVATGVVTGTDTLCSVIFSLAGMTSGTFLTLTFSSPFPFTAVQSLCVMKKTVGLPLGVLNWVSTPATVTLEIVGSFSAGAYEVSILSMGVG